MTSNGEPEDVVETEATTEDDDGSVAVGAFQSVRILPLWLQVSASLVLAAIAILVLIPLLAHTYYPGLDAPKDLDLATIATFCIAGLLLINLPWERLHLVLKKVGPIEFQEAQKKEQAEALAPLERQIEELQNIVKAFTTTGEKPPHEAVANLGKAIDHRLAAEHDSHAMALLAFLQDRRGRFFNASRIRKLEKDALNPREFSRFSNQEIYRLLRKLLAAGLIHTMTSRQGNTLYGAT